MYSDNLQQHNRNAKKQKGKSEVIHGSHFIIYDTRPHV